MNAAQLSLTAWRQKAPTKKAALRVLLADGRFHDQQEMAKVAGYRYGAALFCLHNEMDFGTGLTPLHYRKEVNAKDGTRVRYQQTDKASCDICTAEARARPSEIIKRQEEEIRRLRARVAELEGAL